MGKVIKHTMRGMSRLLKARLVLIFTLLVTAFMWCKPMQATAAITYVATSSAGAASGNLTISAPTGLAAGDVMIISVTDRGTTATAPSMSSTGWTAYPTLAINPASTYRYGFYAYKVATAGDVGANFIVTNGAAANIAANIYAFRGVNTTTPIDVQAGQANTTAALTITTPTITTTTANDTIVFLGQVAETTSVTFSAWATANIPPASWTAINNAGTTNGSNGAAYATLAAAGATGAGSATITTSSRNGGVLIALKPISIVNPTITTILPNNMTQGTGPTTVTINGTGFQSGATVTFSGTGITTGAVTFVSSTQLTLPVTVAANATAGARTMTVTNPDTGFATGVFTVNATPADTLLVSANATIATNAKESDSGVVMQRMQLNSNTNGDSQVILSSITMDDAGNATNIANVRIYIDSTSSSTLPGTAVQIGSQASWSGASTTIPLNQGTAADRTVTTANKFLYVVFDMTFGQVGKTVQSHVTAVGVSSPDSGATGLNFSSSLITLTAGVNAIITNCGGCHFYPGTASLPADGTARNVPAGLFVGNHATHAGTAAGQYAFACTKCHKDNTAKGNAHQGGFINLTGSSLPGNAYTLADVNHQKVVSNTPAFGTCSNFYCHSNGTSATTPPGPIPAKTSPTWGAAAGSLACNGCHGAAADGRPNYTAGTPKANAHITGATHSLQTCDVCHDSVTYSGGVYTPVVTLHNNGAYNIKSSLGYAPGTAAAGGTCGTPGCHGSINWGGSLGCIDCHGAAINSPNALALGGPATRLAIVPDFSLASKHTRSRGTAVTNNDCGVCHMEGTAADGKVNGTYHGNGYIELRDPDLGTTIKGVTHSGTTSTPGVYTSTATDARPVQFSRNLGSATIEADTAAIMVNLCLKCHDTGGAGSPLAIVPGGAAGKPFAGTVAANPGGNVLDVAAQFASSNRSFHPVLVRQNNGYVNTGGTRMVAPWNGVATTASTTVYGPLITCWDCHAPNSASGILTSSGVHGGTPNGTDAVELRGNVYVNSATATTTALNLCVNCHVVTGNTTNHSTGSAITSSTNGSMTYFTNRCFFCHGSSDAAATKPARPIPAGDAHGFSTYADNTAIPVSDGYAFFRRKLLPHSVKQVGATAYTANCGSATGICNQSMGNYTPGGVY